MPSTTSTENLGLSQFADSDRPTWRGDYNSDMRKIDEGFTDVKSAADNATTNASAALLKAQDALDESAVAGEALSKANDALSAASGAETVAGNAVTAAQGATDTANTALAGMNSIVPKASDLRLEAPYLSGALSALRAGIANAAASTRIVTLGSSTIGGGGASRDSLAFVNRLAFRSGATGLASLTGSGNSGSGVQWYQGAVGGGTAASYLPGGHLTRISELQPKYVIHMVGSNDAATGVSPDSYRAAVENACESIEAAVPGVVNILIHAHRRIDIGMVYDWSLYGNALSDVAASNPTRRVFVDMMRYLDVRGTNLGNRWGFVGTDGIHLTDKAHMIYANILSVLLNIPTEVDDPEVRYDLVFPPSNNYTANADLSTVNIPAVPYPREVVFDGVVTSVTPAAAGLASEIQFGIGSLGNISMRCRGQEGGEASETHSLSGSFFLAPNTAATAYVRISPAAGTTMNVSGNENYTRVAVKVKGV